MGGVTRRNLRKWAEAKQRRAEQARAVNFGSDGYPLYGWLDEMPRFGTYVAPTVWLPMVEKPLFPDAVGELLRAVLNPKPTPGPPYTHTITAPPGWEYDDEGEPIRPLFWPSLTIEARTPAAYAPIGQERPDSTGLHPLLLDHDIDRRLP